MPVSVWSLFQALFAVFGIVLQWTLLGGFAGFTMAAFFWLGAIRPRLRRPQQERIMLFGGVVALSLLWGILAGFSVGLTRAYGVAKQLIRGSHWNTFDEQLDLEARTIGESFDTDDAKVRIAAFVEASARRRAERG